MYVHVRPWLYGSPNRTCLCQKAFTRGNHFRKEHVISTRNILLPRGRYHFGEEDIISTIYESLPPDRVHFQREEIVFARKKPFPRGGNSLQGRNVSARKKYFHPQERKIFARMDLTPRGRNFPAWRICPHYWVEWITGWMLVVWNIAIGYKHNLCHAETISSSRKCFLPRRSDIFRTEVITSSRKNVFRK